MRVTCVHRLVEYHTQGPVSMLFDPAYVVRQVTIIAIRLDQLRRLQYLF